MTDGIPGFSIPLGELAFCPDCSVAFSAKENACPKCGSESGWAVVPWGRPKQTGVCGEPSNFFAGVGCQRPKGHDDLHGITREDGVELTWGL